MILHLRRVVGLEPSEQEVDVLLARTCDCHGLARHRITESSERVVPPQRFRKTLQVQLWILRGAAHLF